MLYSPSSHAAGASGFHFPYDANAPTDSISVSDVDFRAAINLPSGSSYSFDSNGILTTSPPSSSTVLAQAQAAQMSMLTQAYVAAIAQPVGFTSKAGVAKTYQADPDSVGKLQNMLAACSGAQATPTGFYWLSADNTQEPFTYADLQGLAAAMGAQGFTAFAHLQTLKAEVRAASDPAAVAAIVW